MRESTTCEPHIRFRDLSFGCELAPTLELYETFEQTVITVEGLVNKSNQQIAGLLTLSPVVPFTKACLQMLLGAEALESVHAVRVAPQAEDLYIETGHTRSKRVHCKVIPTLYPTFKLDTYFWSTTGAQFWVLEYISDVRKERASEWVPSKSVVTPYQSFEFYFESNDMRVPVYIQVPITIQIRSASEQVHTLEKDPLGLLMSRQKVEIRIAPVLSGEQFLNDCIQNDAERSVSWKQLSLKSFDFVVFCPKAKLRMRFCDLQITHVTSEPLNTYLGSSSTYTLTSKPLISNLIKIESNL